ncbi:MAG: DUF5057 domain-containing protein [Eubacteriales bacterium]|nr:DUF5057 domain-containing protein [Eubacteriales bacterium]
MRKHRKRVLSGVAFLLAVVMTAGAILHTEVTVEASYAMMPGIENIVSENSQEEPFRILEIVDEKTEAEIGYYVSGQEPYVKLYTYRDSNGERTFSTVEEALSVLPTKELREGFMIRYQREDGKLVADVDGKPKLEQVSGSRGLTNLTDLTYRMKTDGTDHKEESYEEKYPLSYTEEYQETYFPPEESEGWKQVQLSQVRMDEVRGHYEYRSDGTGDYTKEEQEYMPIRENKREEANGKTQYRENIRGFYYDEGEGAPYSLTFEEVDNSKVNEAFSKNDLTELQKDYDPAQGGYGYYENVYGGLTKDIADDLEKSIFTFPGEYETVVTVRQSDDTAKGTYQSVPGDEEGAGEEIQEVTGEEDSGKETKIPSATDGGTSSEPFTDTPFSSREGASDGFLGDAFTDHGQEQDMEAFGEGVSQVSYSHNLLEADVIAADAFGSGEGEISVEEDPFAAQTEGGGQGTAGAVQGEKENGQISENGIQDGEGSSQGSAGDAQDGGENDQMPANGIQDGEESGQGSANGAQDGEEGGQGSANGFQDGGDGQAAGDHSQDGEPEEGASFSENPLALGLSAGVNGTPNIGNPDTAGSQANPYIYLGKNIKEFPYYKYEKIGDLNYVKAKAQEASASEGGAQGRTGHEITLETDGKYYIWRSDEEGKLQKYPLSLVKGRQMVEKKDVKSIPDALGYNYYYRIKEASFCCKAEGNTDETVYDGWYHSKINEDNPYLEVKSGETATHYITDAKYTLTPGQGDYDFKANENEASVEVQVASLYYKGGLVNHDWLKRYVFHLDPEKEEFERFAVSVDTLTVGELSGTAGRIATNTGGQLSAEEIFAAAPDGFSDAVSASPEILGDGTRSVEDADLSTFSGEPFWEGVPAESSFTESVSAEEPFVEGVPAENSVTGSVSAEEFLMEGASGKGAFTEESSGEEPFTEESAGEESFTEDVSAEEDFMDVEIQPVRAEGSQESVQGMGLDKTFADGETTGGTEVTQVPALEDYDLIYVNGSLSKDSAEKVLSLGLSLENPIPVILNRDKVKEGSDLYNTFSPYMREDKTHFVNRNFYFFSNAWEPGGTAHLVNTHFHMEFGGVQEAEDGTTAAAKGSQADGFSEILEYIDSENEYRKLAYGELGDGEDFRLPTTLSQARVVEYIINYRYRRNVLKKDVIRVLDIEPAKTTAGGNIVKGVINKDDIADSLGMRVPISNLEIEDCCHSNSGLPQYVIDGEKGETANNWHSYYGSGRHEVHWLTITLKSPGCVGGFVYTPRIYSTTNSGHKNGLFLSFTVVLENIKGEVLYTEDYEKNESEYTNEREDHWYRFDKVYTDVACVKFQKIKGYGGHASCREIGLLASPLSVEITTMTSSEFVGNIQDLNKEYDMICWGGRGRAADADVAKFSNGGDENSQMLYSHIGSAMVIAGSDRNKAQGILDSDYDKNGKVITTELKAGGVGSVRGSGNDITGQQVRALLEFAKSGYPLIVDDSLYKDEDSMGEGSIDESKVDNSSYVYRFLTELGKLRALYPNVCRLSEFEKGNRDFYVNLPKPVIRFIEKPVSAVKDVTGHSGEYIEGHQLKYVFQIEDEAQTSSANARYHCELFLDLNSDGNFSVTERLDDIQVSGADGIVLTKNAQGRYELKLGETYRLTREIPENYGKLITWKLKVSNNERNQIWTTEQGYTRSRPTKTPEIKVLQISPNKGGNWKLNEPNGAFQELLKEVEEYDIKIVRMGTEAYANAYVKNKNLLDDYHMLIIGFADMYENIPNKKPTNEPLGAVDAILQFIQDGKSVLFSHDTTSYFCNRNNAASWGHGFNYILRPLLGMDRYGVIAEDTKSIIGKGFNPALEDPGLRLGSPDWETVYQAQGQNVLQEGEDSYLYSNGDMAYKNGSACKETCWETQGFTPHVMTTTFDTTTKARQVNEGAITEYPYKIPKELKVETTHSQYYQLAMEEDADRDGTNDIIVWYCLGDKKYDQSPKDVRNYYYLYSKGNVMYTGVGHQGVTGEAEMKLFINTIVASYRASAVEPEIKFVNGFSRTAEKITSDYYMTDQYLGTGETNVVDNEKQISFTVDDYNLVAASSFADNARSMDLRLFIESDSEDAKEGSEYGVPKIKEKVVPLDVSLFQDTPDHKIPCDSSGVYKVHSGSVYSFSIDDLERYVMENWSKEDNMEKRYKKAVNIYAHVSVSFRMYGEDVEGENLAQLTLRQRQLFDLD